MWFQRSSVIVTDLVLAGGAAYAGGGRAVAQQRAVFFAVVASAGLLMVDHVHFQYNGVLLGARLALLGASMKTYSYLLLPKLYFYTISPCHRMLDQVEGRNGVSFGIVVS